ncbi:MAG: PD-(D/E)XK nuclease family protein [Thermomicrobiales bacterium]
MSLQALLDHGLALDRPPRLTATDIASWLRLSQCDRFLRFQLEYRNERRSDASGFLEELDVAPQPLPSLLTGSGVGFEETILSQIAQLMPLRRFDEDRRSGNDNSRLVRSIEALVAGERIAITQPRLHIELAGWELRGDLDLLLVHRDEDDRLHLTVLDMKSSADSRVEHSIQVAMYSTMLRELCRRSGVEIESLSGGIIYRGTDDPDALTDSARRKLERSQEAAESLGLVDAFLDLTGNDRTTHKPLRI